MPDVDELPLIDTELLAYLSDEELGAYLDALAICQRVDGTWRLQPRQQTAEDTCDALMAKGDVFELLYGGAGAGGKSEWLLFHLDRLARRFPGFSGLLLRRNYTELERTAILRSLARFDRADAKYVASRKRWEYDNGSIVEFGFCDSDVDVFQYDSAEYACVAWDELTQFPTDFPYRYLFSRVRVPLTLSVQGLTPHVVAGTNPHRTGVAWVKPRWVELGRPEEVHVVETDIDGKTRRVSRVFIPAKMSDNRYVDADSYRAMLSVLDDATRRAIEDGSWDVVEGQYFREWRRELHVVRPFAIPGWWRKIGGLDFGYANPFAHEWIAFDGDGNAYVYREAYRRGLTPQEQVALIRKYEDQGEKIDYRVADPSIWTRTGAGPPIATQYLSAGLPFRKANNARIDGWQRLRDYLRPQVRRHNEETGLEELAPRLFVFDTCVDLVRTLPMLVHDPKKPEDLDTDGEDHAADALRYALMSIPLRSKQTSTEPVDRNVFRDWDAASRARARRGEFDHPTLGRM